MMLGINGCPELTVWSCIASKLNRVGDRGALVSWAVKGTLVYLSAGHLAWNLEPWERREKRTEITQGKRKGTTSLESFPRVLNGLAMPLKNSE